MKDAEWRWNRQGMNASEAKAGERWPSVSRPGVVSHCAIEVKDNRPTSTRTGRRGAGLR